MRVLVTGANGQLGRELQRVPWPDATILDPMTSAQLDITDEAAVSQIVASSRPDVIVNAAAYTGVDTAEDEPDRAQLVNATAVEHLAAAADQNGAALIHVSTDYVFDGTKTDWYDETDHPDDRHDLATDDQYGELRGVLSQ